MDYDLDLTLRQMRQLDTTGNIVPHSWYKAVTFQNGKLDLLGMMILAEIVYWYRPTEVRDQYTGKLVEYRKKFKGDMLQRNYKSFANQFGVSSRQAMDAISRLEKNGFVIKEVRNVRTQTVTLGNVLFLAPNIEKLLSLQTETTNINPIDPYGSDDEEGGDLTSAGDPPYTFERISSYDETYKLMQSNVGAPTFERRTYTENTTEISPEIKKTAAEIKPEVEKIAGAAGFKKNSSGTLLAIPSAVCALEKKLAEIKRNSGITPAPCELSDFNPQSELRKKNPAFQATALGLENSYRPNSQRRQGAEFRNSTRNVEFKAIPENNTQKSIHASELALKTAERNFPQMLIEKSLTVLQEAQVVKTAEEMVKRLWHPDAKQLIDEIRFSLLCSNSFTQAGNDFFKKLNTIVKCIREGRWTRPVKLAEKELKKSTKIEQSYKIKQQELEGECAHWKYRADFFLEKNNPEQMRVAISEHKKALAQLTEFKNAQTHPNRHFLGEGA